MYEQIKSTALLLSRFECKCERTARSVGLVGDDFRNRWDFEGSNVVFFRERLVFLVIGGLWAHE